MMNKMVPFNLILLSAIAALSEGSMPNGGNPSGYGAGYGNYNSGYQSGMIQNDPQQSALGPKPSSPLPPGWTEYFDPTSGQPYYHNANDGTTTWDRPVAESADPESDENPGDQKNVTETEGAEEQSGMDPNTQPQSEEIRKMDGTSGAPPGQSTFQVPEGQVQRTSEGNVLTGYKTDEQAGISSPQKQSMAAASVGVSGSEPDNNMQSQNTGQRPWGTPQSSHSTAWGMDRNRSPEQNLAQNANTPPPIGANSQGSGIPQPQNRIGESSGLPDEQATPSEDSGASQELQQGLVRESPEQMTGRFQAQGSNDPNNVVQSGNVDTSDDRQGMPQEMPPPGYPNGGPNMYRGGIPPRPYQQQMPPAGTNVQQLPDQRHQAPPVGQQSQVSPPREGSPQGQSSGPGEVQGRPGPGSQQYVRQQYPPQPYPNQYGPPPRYQQRPPSMQHPPYGQYQYQQYSQYGQPPQQQQQQGQPMQQLVPQETQAAVRGALGSAWQGILGFRNRTKEAMETAATSVANSAKEASQSFSTTSTSLLGQARNTFGSFFEPNAGAPSPYSLTGSRVDQAGKSVPGYTQQPPGNFPPPPVGYPYPPPQQQQPTGGNYPPMQRQGNYPPRPNTGNPYYNHPGYPPRYSNQGPDSNDPSLQGQQSPRPRPLQLGNPYPPGYRPPEPRGDQPYIPDRNGNPRQPPQQQRPPLQTQYPPGAQPPPQGWQQRGPPPMNPPAGGAQQQQQQQEQHQKDPDKKDGQDPTDVWSHPGLSPDF